MREEAKQQTNEQIFYICFAAKAVAKNKSKSKSIAKYLIWHGRRRGGGRVGEERAFRTAAAAALGAGIPCWIHSSASASALRVYMYVYMYTPMYMYLGLSENCICMSIALVYLALLFLTLPKHTRSQADGETDFWNECS